mmetsp:Transcript_24187/g.27404  ORF Transcript_24187/g.27404 Transcript_24187/m.27404 type:complete len:185 (-) Transcript_24187:395-949(-)
MITSASTSCLPQMTAKTTFYASNGSGRDSYIWNNNGGICKTGQSFNPLECGSFRTVQKRYTRDQHPSIHSKSVHYHSDGTGRDSYIGIHSGGFHRPHTAGEYKRTFYNTLRHYERRPTSHNQKDLLTKCQNRMHEKDYYTAQKMKHYQRNQNDRLSRPKRLSDNYHTVRESISVNRTTYTRRFY